MISFSILNALKIRELDLLLYQIEVKLSNLEVA